MWPLFPLHSLDNKMFLIWVEPRTVHFVRIHINMTLGRKEEKGRKEGGREGSSKGKKDRR